MALLWFSWVTNEVVDVMGQLGHGQALLSSLGFWIEVWVGTGKSDSGGSCEMTSVRVMLSGMCLKSGDFLFLAGLWGGIL